MKDADVLSVPQVLNKGKLQRDFIQTRFRKNSKQIALMKNADVLCVPQVLNKDKLQRDFIQTCFEKKL